MQKLKMLELDKFKTLVDVAPLVSIDFIIKNQDNKILLGKRVNKPAKDYFFTLGGRVFKKETLNEAKKRVLKDEIGLNIEDFNPKAQHKEYIWLSKDEIMNSNEVHNYVKDYFKNSIGERI
ncbi:NUDIX domain-containing protein [Aliarcobacter cryaerophilus]|uniref:NUDIX domain-containing protein n=1 Tax=Aliarcobacter cryaerophilus TaxID=28198 RepID=UPI0021B687B3|nr:NUDIX domain-containing protein [Aliarcobacter cryaerophilus]MCT7539727.1 NUDIX domain-containing protein [Aliarcobacter cryaerophilus]